MMIVDQAEKKDAGKEHFDLGMRYMNGEGTAKDPEKAAAEFKRAVEKGYPGALERLNEAEQQIPEWRTRNTALTEQFRTTLSQPWTWSSEVVQVCWCRSAGVPEYYREFEGIDGRTLIKNIDEAWMKSHNIPHGLAVTVFHQHIERLRQMAQNAGIFTRIYWRI